MRNLHYLPKLTLIFSRPELMAIHMQDNNLSNVESEKYSSETINIWPSTSSACVIPSGCKNKQKKKGKKVLGLENFPSIIEVLNPNDLFDEKSKIFPKLFSHKSSLFNIEGITQTPKTHQYFDELHAKIEPILQFHFESSINFASGAQAWGLEGSILKDVTMQILEE